MTKLQTLVCYENQLSDLYVRNNKQLKELGCDLNHLTSLDISQNAELYSLSACNSGLEYLVIVKNPLLIKDYKGERSEKQKYRDGYYFRPDGTMAVKEYRDGYWLNKDGVCTGFLKAVWRRSGRNWWSGI